MFVASLQSGSNGNCICVEAAGVTLLFDAGISGRQLELRLGAIGRDIRDVDAIIISHDHRDHSRCAGIYQRKFGLPVHMTRRTREAADARCGLGPMEHVHEFSAGQTMRVGSVQVETIPTPHDAADGVMFIVKAGREFEDLGRAELGEPCSGASPAFVRGRIYLRGQKHLYCVGPPR